MEVIDPIGCHALHEHSRFLLRYAQILDNVSQRCMNVLSLVTSTGGLIVDLLREVLKKILNGLLLLEASGMNLIQVGEKRSFICLRHAWVLLPLG